VPLPPSRFARQAAFALRTTAPRPRLQGTIGSSNVATGAVPIPRPDTKPCVVPLFEGDKFADFTPKVFTYAPPAACPFPWSKVVLHLTLAVGAGNQFDRTAEIGLGGTTIFFGTTAEPASNLSPSWAVDRDLTDLSTLFRKTQSGEIYIGNVVNSTYTSTLYGGASLEFYPPDKAYPAPKVADIILPLADMNGNPVGLSNSMSLLSKSFTPPQYVERAFLDVMAQSQSGDEFWYTCFPNNLAKLLNNCGSTAFRETEVQVDGRPAGVAPVYPWIYTGGIDPFLWLPIPGVQTLDFKPFRVDLTPFAGSLDDGKQHTVAVSVYNADNYFSVTGTLLLYLDHSSTKPLTGGVDSDDLAATPPLEIAEGGAFNSSGDGNGTIDTKSRRLFKIVGHVTSSSGTTTSTASEALDFTQHQAIASTNSEFIQEIHQDTAITAYSERTTAGGSTAQKTTADWPLTFLYYYVIAKDGSAAVKSVLSQGYVADSTDTGGASTSSSDLVSPQDTLTFNSSGNFTGNTGTSGGEIIRYSNSGTGQCYGERLISAANVLTNLYPIACK
jgi:hypothetical protein